MLALVCGGFVTLGVGDGWVGILCMLALVGDSVRGVFSINQFKAIPYFFFFLSRFVSI